ncbi:MAG: anthranilate phosphoribosyltransferase [Deltaproteobacteria bacterium]|nr:anthranilate phosphoribosyltransferase [Deltaproteobacteria bacterium]
MTSVAESVREGDVLGEARAESVFKSVLDGTMPDAEVEALLVALHQRKEAVSEIVGAARAAERLLVPFKAPGLERALDTCGTGGDGCNTFNVSTAVALAAAAWGATVVKHGNRAASSKSGSADVLEALGFALDAPHALLATKRFAFLFAPAHHPGFARVAPIRRRLGHRTIFNLLGPLVNPAGVRRQVMGVFDESWVEPIGRVLARLGRTRAMVVHGGLGEATTDEVAPWGETKIAVIEGGEVRLRTFTPSKRFTLDGARGGDAKENAAIVRAVLGGEGTGAAQELVALNLAAAMWAHGDGGVFEDNLDDARRFLSSGETRAFFSL